ncbi:MAG TPA: hypothetical protein VG944_03335 [Fimbriimonas sp.]|nr:hypothetical protein [Fimbriimonas sp.]
MRYSFQPARNHLGRRLVLASSLAILTVMIAGCAQKDRQALSDTTVAAAENVGQAFKAGWASLDEQLSRLDWDSSRKDLEGYKARLEKMRGEASKTATAQIDALQLQIKRIDAAEKVQDIRKKCDNALADMKAKSAEVGQDVERSRQELESASNRYNGLMQQLDDAKTEYDSLRDKAEEAWSAVSP